MLDMMKEVANRFLPFFTMPNSGDDGLKIYSELEVKARKKLKNFGLNEYQINKLVEF
jgi:hypothetical protein